MLITYTQASQNCVDLVKNKIQLIFKTYIPKTWKQTVAEL